MKAALLLASLALLSFVLGCESQSSTRTLTVPDPDAEAENARLKQQVTSLEGQKTGLEKELIAREGDISAARRDAQQWRDEYEKARKAQPAGAEAVPPELMKAFIDLARAGGPWDIGEGGTLKAGSDVLFDSGKVVVKPAGIEALREIAPRLIQILTDKRVVLAIEGHTDNVPVKYSGFKDNRQLSLMRAHSVLTFLSQQDIPPAAMRAVGMGEFHPVASNDTAEGRALNRRVELRLVNAGLAPAPAPAPAAETE